MPSGGVLGLAACVGELTPYPLIAAGMVPVSAGTGGSYAANTTAAGSR
jgi:hypothetical protein